MYPSYDRCLPEFLKTWYLGCHEYGSIGLWSIHPITNIMRILPVIYAAIAITRVTATWSDAVTDEPAGQRYGVAERDMFFDLKDLVTTLRTTAGANPPYWMTRLPGSEFLPDFGKLASMDPTRVRGGYNVWPAGVNGPNRVLIGDGRVDTIKNAYPEIDANGQPTGHSLVEPVAGGIRNGFVKEYKWKAGGKVTGDFKGVPVWRTGEGKGPPGMGWPLVPLFSNPSGTLSSDLAGGNEYTDLADRLGQTFDSPAMEAVAGGQLEHVTEADGSTVSIGKMVGLYIQRLPDPATRNTLNTKLATFQRSIRTMVEGRLATMRSFSPEFTPTTPGPAGGVTLDLSAQYRDIFGEAIEGHERDLRTLLGHADVFAKWTKLGTAIWRAPNPELGNEVTPFACSVTVTKRSLAKRADGSCIPKITVLNRDSLNAKDKGNAARLNRQAQILRMIKFFTGNNKILRNDNGGTPSEDPFSPGDISARDVHEDAEDQDAAWGLVTDAFSSVLDNQPEVVDKGLAASIIRAFEDDYRHNIAMIKARADTRLVMSLFRNQMITAESRKNTINTLAKKFLGIYGTSYRDVKGANDPPGDTGAEGGEPDVDVVFDSNKYGDPQDIGSVAESGVLDDLAETTGAIGTVGKQPDIENGEEAGIDVSRMLPGTDEYAQVYRVMATVTRDLIKNPNTPKWKLVRLRAMLSKNSRSLEMRIKVLQSKEKNGETTTKQEKDEYEAIDGFHRVVAGALETRNVDGMTTTPEDKAKIDAMPEYTEDPGNIIQAPTKIAVKVQQGKPAFTRAGQLAKVPSSSRKTVGRVGSKQGTAKGGKI